MFNPYSGQIIQYYFHACPVYQLNIYLTRSQIWIWDKAVYCFATDRYVIAVQELYNNLY